MTNKEIAKILFEMSELLAMDAVPFKPRAYERASETIGNLQEDVSEIYKNGGLGALMEISGVGEAIAGHIRDLLKTGSFKEYKQLKKKFPVDISGLSAIEGVGPKMIQTLWKKLKIRNCEDLEKALHAGKIAKLPRFGKKSEEKIIKGIEFLKKSGGRAVLGLVLKDIRILEKTIGSFPGVHDAVVAGSVRRRRETVGDIDIVVSSSKPESTTASFLKLSDIEHIYGSGKTKTMVRLKNGLDADLRVVPPKSFGAALHYFTGSKDHNVALRERAIKMGLKLNEYGLFRGTKMIAGKTEADVYKALGLSYIEPEMREMQGEIEAAEKNRLPKLIGYDDLRGDLQTQTDWTDGENSILEMAEAAKKAGLEYIVITDHTKSLAMTGGADEKKVLRQTKEIDRIQEKITGITILKGAEVNIMKDGSLDIEDTVLAELDVVGAAVHSHFNLSRSEQTQRVIRAMENKNIDILFHPTGRVINKREPIDLDIDEIIKTAKRTGTILEIDAYPERLDLRDEYIRKCIRAGVKMSIDSDAHSVAHFQFLELGIAQARRGWAEKKDIVNTYPLKDFLGLLKSRR